MKNSIKVSIIIPTHNRKNKLCRLLDSIYQSEFPKNKIEVIVVDNGSTDGTCENIIKKFPNIVLFSLGTNLMSATAREYGVQYSSGEFIFFIDDDNILNKKCILKLVNYMDVHSNVGIVAPLMLYYHSPDIIWCAGAIINRYGKIQYLGYNMNTREANLIKLINNIDYFPNFYVVRRALISKGLEHDIKNFPHNWSETDYCIRAKKMGYKLMTVMEAITWHDINYKGKLTRVSMQNAFDQPRSRILFIKKHEKNSLLQLYYYFILIPCATFYSFKQFIFIQKKERPLKLIINYIRGIINGLLTKP